MTNQLGVHLVATECLKQWWFFRSQYESDQGIDAIVEKAPGEVGTGRLLAIQIKSGRSHFDEPSDGGWWFRFDAAKAKLWLGHALPALIVFADIDNQQAYWQRISNRTVIATGKNFKVEIPRSQTIPTADPEWTELASGLEIRAVDRWDLSLTQLPPGVRRLLESLPFKERSDAALVAVHLAEGRGNPRDIAHALLASSPGWMVRQASWSWRALASYCAEHDLRELSADAFVRAAEDRSGDYGVHIASAALNILPVDRQRSQELAEQARATGHASLLMAIVDALLEHPEGDAGPRRFDPIMLGDSESVRRSQVAQNFLSDQAARSGDLDAACHHSRLALDVDPDDSSTMVIRADALVRRAHSRRRQEADLPTAIDLLGHALEQRRRWAGPTLPVLLALVEACAYNGQFEKMLQLCLSSPRGTASEDEATHPAVRRGALYAADAVGRRDLVEEIAGELEDSIQDRVARLKLGILRLTAEDEVQIWQEELLRAIDENDYSAAGMAAVALAVFGVDASKEIAQLVQRSIIPEIYVPLIAALVVAKDDLDAALPELRSLARRDPLCAEYAIMRLTREGRHHDVAALCQTLYEHTGNPYYLICQAQRLVRLDDPSAEAIALQATLSTEAFPTERADLLNFVGGRAAGREAWESAEKHLADALSLRSHPTSPDIWRLVYCQIKLGRVKRAASTIADYRPTVTNLGEGELWLQAHIAVLWDEATVKEGLAIARQLNDPRLSTAILGHVVTTTRGVPVDGEDADVALTDADDQELEQRRQIAQRSVPADLHRQAYAELFELVDQFGVHTGITIMQGEASELAQQAISMMQKTANDLADAEEALAGVRDARLPQGFAATVLGRSYATALVQRSLGALVSGAADDDEHAEEIKAADSAIGLPVVVDASTLLVLTGMSSKARLEGQFTVLQLPAEALRDIYRSAYDIRALAGSPGTTSWSQRLGSVIFYELAYDEYTRQLRRAQALEDVAERVTVRIVPTMTLFTELSDLRHASWLHPIQLAHDAGVALWSDDLGLRRLARSVGVSCFGTPALVDALRDRRLAAATSPAAIEAALENTAADNRDLAFNFVVDVALHLEDLLVLAERDEWQPRAASVVLSRSAWWAWQASPIDDLMVLFQNIAAHAPSSLAAWQNAAMVGLARTFRPSTVAARLLVVVALLGYGVEAPLDVVVSGMRTARAVAQELNLQDPMPQLPDVARKLALIGKCRDPEALTEAVRAALADEDDREQP